MIERLPLDMARLDEPEAYANCWREAYDLLRDLYGAARFRENLRKFYLGEYTIF